MQSSLLNYYGLSNSTESDLQSYQFDYSKPIKDAIETIDLIDQVNGQDIVLVLSIHISTISERVKPTSTVLNERFGIVCDLLAEHQINTFEGIVRICAIRVYEKQFSLLLSMLYEHTSRAFLTVFRKDASPHFILSLVTLFESGLLTPKVIKACVNTVLKENASFLHILHGADGYSINFFRNA